MSDIREPKKNILGVIISIILIFLVAFFYIKAFQMVTDELSEITTLKPEFQTTIEKSKDSNE